MLIGALSLVMLVWLGHLDELLAQVHTDRSLDDGHHEDPARTLDLLRAGPAQGEDQDPLVLVDDLDCREEQEQGDQDDEQEREADRDDLHPGTPTLRAEWRPALDRR